MLSKAAHDVIVVGAGVVGTAAAYAAAKAGKRVLLLERGSFDHAEGSSNGESRVIRMTYPALHYARMMPECYDAWQKLASESGDDELLVKTGGIIFGPAADAGADGVMSSARSFDGLIENCRECGVAVEHLDAEAVPARFPGMVLPAGERAIFNADLGVLRATRCVQALRKVALELGAEVLDRSPAVAIRAGDAGRHFAEVEVAGGKTYQARSVVMACGGWAPMLLKQHFGMAVPERRLQPFVTGVSYWKLSEAWKGKFNADAGHGTIIDFGAAKGVYSTPSLEHPEWLKVCTHVEVTEPYAIGDMDNFKDRFGPGGYSDRFKQLSHDSLAPWLQTHFKPEVFSQPLELAHFEACVYTMTPDQDFVIDVVAGRPGQGSVVLASACSGHGFKLAPVTGAAAVALGLEGAEAAAKVLKFSSVAEMKAVIALERLFDGPGAAASKL